MLEDGSLLAELRYLPVAELTDEEVLRQVSELTEELLGQVTEFDRMLGIEVVIKINLSVNGCHPVSNAHVDFLRGRTSVGFDLRLTGNGPQFVLQELQIRLTLKGQGYD